MSTEFKKGLGSLYFYQRSNNELVRVDDQYIKQLSVQTVKDMLTQIRSSVSNYEALTVPDDDDFKHLIVTCGDIVFKCVEICRWRKGFAFVFLQISQKNNGAARVSVYTTDTNHHPSIAFGTNPPSPDDANCVLTDYATDKQRLVSDLNELKKYHDTKISTANLAKTLQW